MKKIKIILILITFGVIAGCGHVVKSPEPFGLKPLQLHSDSFQKYEYNVESPGDLKIKVLDAKTGLVELSVAQTKNPESSDWKTIRAYMMFGTEHKYISIPIAEIAEDHPDADGFLFACFENYPNRAIIWLPDVDKFREAVREGMIEGEEVDIKGSQAEGDIILGEPTKEMFEVIDSGEHGVFFKWKDPKIIKKTKKSKAEQSGPANSGSADAPPE